MRTESRPALPKPSFAILQPSFNALNTVNPRISGRGNLGDSNNMIVASSQSAQPRVVTARRERWFAVQTLHRRESGAQLQLEAQGFTTFVPQITRTVRHARRLRTVR